MVWNKPSRQYVDGSCTGTVGKCLKCTDNNGVAFEQLGSKGWNWDLFHKYVKKAERCVFILIA